MTLHVDVPEHGHGFAITDMENAGKRGKRCRVLRFSGWRPHVGCNDSTSEAARSFTLCWEMQRFAQSVRDELANGDGVPGGATFDDVHAAARSLVDAARLPEHCARLYVDVIRGIDAPRPILTAGVEGKWSARADIGGVSVNDDADRFNEPCVITRSEQTKASAYAIAAKVWDRVKAAATFGEAWAILTNAGWKGHYYCRVD